MTQKEVGSLLVSCALDMLICLSGAFAFVLKRRKIDNEVQHQLFSVKSSRTDNESLRFVVEKIFYFSTYRSA